MIVNTRLTVLLAAAALILAAAVGAREPRSSDKAGSEVSDYQRDVEQYPEAALDANAAMFNPRIDSNPHIFMTVLERKNEDDDRRAAVILDILRKALDKYKDYRVAEANGYHVFMPKVPQPQYHFTNQRYAFAAAFLFNPAHPTSLLYKKTRGGYELQGALFTAPKNATKQQLNDRIPLSVARWHEHVNMCVPAKSTPGQKVDWKEFGLSGSIATQDACVQVGGRWIPQVFGWMVHIYPFETDPDKIWAR
jgi:hypothetical protein